MKIKKTYPLLLLAFLIALIAYCPNAYADPSGGGTAAVSVADSVHAAAEVASLFDEFNQVMGDYELEASEQARKALLDRARKILAQLIEQANNVESEISILSKKKLDKLYSNKLDRVLSSVLQMREMAQKKMQVANERIRRTKNPG
jgi:uncharacterized protein Yka (UPF0111/DUF47 family)